MAKKKRNNQRQPQQQKQPTGNIQNNTNAVVAPAPAVVKSVTIEDVAASISQAEVESKK